MNTMQEAMASSPHVEDKDAAPRKRAYNAHHGATLRDHLIANLVSKGYDRNKAEKRQAADERYWHYQFANNGGRK